MKQADPSETPAGPGTRVTLGNGLRVLGWMVVAGTVFKYAKGCIELATADPSMAGYIPLVLGEGLVYVVAGLLLVGLGRLVRGRRKA